MCVVRAAVSPWLERLEHIFRTCSLNPLSLVSVCHCLVSVTSHTENPGYTA